MAMKKISDLTEATSVALDDLLEIEAAAGSRKAKKVNVLALITETVTDANHTIDDREDSQIVLMSTGASDRTCALPDSSIDDVEIGDLFRVLKVDAGAGKVTVNRQGTDTIDAQTSGVPLYSQGNYALVMYLGSGAYSVLDLKSNGSNSNGYFLLHADGSQHCDSIETSAVSASKTWTFPRAFVGTPVHVQGTHAQACGGALFVSTSTAAASSVEWSSIVSTTGAYFAGAQLHSLHADGRWRT